MPESPPIACEAIRNHHRRLLPDGTFRPDLLYGPRRHIREERTKSLHHRRVRKDSVAEPRIWQICQHRRLHCGDDLAGFGANHREADNAVVITDKSLHEALFFVSCLRPQHSAYRQPRDAHSDALALRFAFGQSHTGKRRVGEHAVWNQAIARAALSSGEVVLDDAKIIDGYMGELWAAGHRKAAAGPPRRAVRQRRLPGVSPALSMAGDERRSIRAEPEDTAPRCRRYGRMQNTAHGQNVGMIRARRYSSNCLKKPSVVSGCLVKPARRILPRASTMSYSMANRNSRKPQFTSGPSSGWASSWFAAICFQRGASAGMNDDSGIT